MKEKIISILNNYPIKFWIDEEEWGCKITREIKDGYVSLSVTDKDDLEEVIIRELLVPYI